MRAVLMREYGGPEVLEVADVPDPVAGDGQILLDVDLAGVNFRDTHASEAAAGPLPLVPGMEVVGRTADGRRLAAVLPRGGYAGRAAVAAELAVPIPDGVDDLTALALLVQGTTAWLVLTGCAHVRAGESVLVMAAAGGVGSLAVQVARSLGARPVIGCAGTAAKRELAADLGADVVLDASAPDFDDRVRSATGGRGVDVALDMVGGDVTARLLGLLAPLGRLVFYGTAGRRRPAAVEPERLMAGSTTISGFQLEHAASRPGLVPNAMTELFDRVERGELVVVSGGVHPLSGARAVHEQLGSGRTVGKLALDPHL